MQGRGGEFKTAGLYLFTSVSVLLALCKIAGLNGWSWWRVGLPFGAYVGFNLTYVAIGFAYLSWIEFAKGNGTTETARIVDDEKRGCLDLGAIHFALFALGVSERASPSVALNGFWNSFGSTGVMIAFGLLAIVNLVMYWSTNVQCRGKSDGTTKEPRG